MSSRVPAVSRHALRRYLERVGGFEIKGVVDGEAVDAFAIKYGVDLKEIEQEIADICAGAVARGASATKRGGFRFVISGRDIITVTRLKTARLRPRPSRVVEEDGAV